MRKLYNLRDVTTVSVFINKNLNCSILPMKTWESDAGVKVCKFTEAEKVPEQMPLLPYLKKTCFKPNVPPFYFLHDSLCPDSLLLSVFFLNNPMFTSSQLVACSSS